MKVKIIYWSGTGNTERMAEAIFEGAKEVNENTSLINVCDAKVEDVKESDVLIFGCPAMGSEELEEEYMRPYMDSVNELLKDKKVALFGSYEWAEGQWMDYWKEELENLGVKVFETLIAYDNPSEDALADCKSLGKAIAK